LSLKMKTVEERLKIEDQRAPYYCRERQMLLKNLATARVGVVTERRERR
jgi:hypothetical protein